jgi:hypothetical protein
METNREASIEGGGDALSLATPPSGSFIFPLRIKGKVAGLRFTQKFS